MPTAQVIANYVPLDEVAAVMRTFNAQIEHMMKENEQLYQSNRKLQDLISDNTATIAILHEENAQARETRDRFNELFNKSQAANLAPDTEFDDFANKLGDAQETWSQMEKKYPNLVREVIV